MPGPTRTPSTPTLVNPPVGRRYAPWRATAMKVVVLVVNGYFLLGMGDCNGGSSSSIHESIPTGPTLSALTLSAGLLNPSFDPNVTSYDTMYIGDTSVTVTPTAADVGTTITVNSSPVTSGNASGAINLPSGNTTITLILTANGLTNTYTITAHRLAQQAYGKASNTGSSDQFGLSVALDGDTLAVGAPLEDSNGTGVNSGAQANNSAASSGAVYVFTRSGSIWTQQAYVKASNTGSGDQFGWSVALDGDTLVVGAPGEASNGTGVNSGAEADNSAANSGAVYVFVRSGTTWTQQAYVKASNTGNPDSFGASVALAGDTLAVGAVNEASNGTGVNSGAEADNSAPQSGAVYVFVRSGTTWTQQAYVKASNTESGDQFGLSVSLTGDTLAVGAIGEDSNGTGVNSGAQADNSASGSGAVYMFTRSGTTWTQQAYVKASNTRSVADFGISVALDGDTLAVGARGEASNGTGVNSGAQADNSAAQAGAVYVFTRSGSTWTQQAYVKASNTESGDEFGRSVALDGDTLAVYAFHEASNGTGVNSGAQADNSAADSGAVYVFTRSGSIWTQQAYVKASNTGSGDGFGRSVALDGDTLAIGALGEESNGTGVNSGAQADNSAAQAGAVYVFR